MLRPGFLSVVSVLTFIGFPGGTTSLLRAEDAPETICTTTYRGSWRILTSANFRISTRSSKVPLDRLPAVCESLRTALQAVWLGTDHADTWRPRCDVVVHRTLTEYTRVLGTGAGNSVGCATIRMDDGRVVGRRIDLRLDGDSGMADALPHELAHVVLADRFRHRRIPPWADEGIGVLAESSAMQNTRAEALRRSCQRGHVFRTRDLLTLSRFPMPNYRDAFYGQSAHLIRFLMERSRSPSQVLDFIDDAMTHGYETALQKHYDIDGPDALDRISWTPDSLSGGLNSVTAGIDLTSFSVR